MDTITDETLQTSLGVHIARTALQYSFDVVDYTFCLWAMNMSVAQYKKINVDEVKGFVKYFLQRIRDLQYTRRDVMTLINRPTLAVFSKMVGQVKEWVATATGEMGTIQEPTKLKSNTISFTASGLVNYLFTHEQTSKKGEIDLVETFKGAAKVKTKSKLQTIEIAINEGTTKAFVPAVLTELVQNSVDAIRSTGGSDKST